MSGNNVVLDTNTLIYMSKGLIDEEKLLAKDFDASMCLSLFTCSCTVSILKIMLKNSVLTNISNTSKSSTPIHSSPKNDELQKKRHSKNQTARMLLLSPPPLTLTLLYSQAIGMIFLLPILMTYGFEWII